MGMKTNTFANILFVLSCWLMFHGANEWRAIGSNAPAIRVWWRPLTASAASSIPERLTGRGRRRDLDDHHRVRGDQRLETGNLRERKRGSGVGMHADGQVRTHIRGCVK
jgi:hypothetical protein